jgi:solute carrier family 8 (sodium/calcium exchanger)
LDFFVRLSEPGAHAMRTKAGTTNKAGTITTTETPATSSSATSSGGVEKPTLTEVTALPLSPGVKDPVTELRLGSRIVARIVVIDDDVPGAFGFECDSMQVTETCAVAECHVVRTGGADGRVELKYRTVSNTAMAGEDFVQREGWLTFDHHESEKTIQIPLIVTGKLSHHNVLFSVELLLGPGDEFLAPGEMPAPTRLPWTSGAIYSASHHRTCVIAISNDANFSNIVDLVMEDLFDDDGNLENTGWGDIQQQSWLQQFEDAIFHENSGDDDDSEDDDDDDDDDDDEPTIASLDVEAGRASGPDSLKPIKKKKDCTCCRCCKLSNIIKTVTRMNTLFMHALSIPWNIFAACAPPPGMCGGYPTFVISLAMVGVVTALIGDVASEFGCFLNIDNGIVAITFVALGTSLPDTFASMSAAVHDSNADASIGNITGSNSVNVFLGLGLPWTIATIYYAILDKEHGVLTQDFIVEAGSLGFSVVVFCGCSFAAFAILMFRRIPCIGGELGANKSVCGIICQWMSTLSLIGLWFLYIVLSVCQNKGWIKTPSWL